MEIIAIKTIENAIGYTFLNKSVLIDAFTHSSFINESRSSSECNERLEFLGDSILDFLVAEKLYFRYNRREGEMTAIRANLVSCEPLAAAVDELDIFRFLRIGNGARNDMEHSKKAKSDLYEAVLAAIYIDSGKKMDMPREFVERTLRINTERHDYKSALQELTQKSMHGALPEYQSVRSIDGKFVERVVVAGEVYGEGEGSTRKKAQQAAAQNALLRLKKA